MNMSQKQEKNLLSYGDTELLKTIFSFFNESSSARKAISSSTTAGIVVGAVTVIAGLLIGPRGLALGGLLGGFGASYLMDGQFKSLSDIIFNEASNQQRKKLADSVRNLLSVENVISLAMLIARMNSSNAFRESLILLINKFVKNYFNYEIQ